MGETVFLRLLAAEDKETALAEEIAQSNAADTTEAERSSARVMPQIFTRTAMGFFHYPATQNAKDTGYMTGTSRLP